MAPEERLIAESVAGLALFDEWAVLDDRNRFAGMGFRQPYRTREEAEQYLAWLLERRTEMEQEAEANKASGFAGGNQAWYRWAGPDGERDRSHRIVHRQVTTWCDAPALTDGRITERTDG